MAGVDQSPAGPGGGAGAGVHAMNALRDRVVADALAADGHDLPTSTLDFLRLAVLDWVGVTVAGATEPSARLLQGFVVDEGGAPVAVALGTDLRMSAQQAALVNGAAGHALDFDDMGLGGTHPSVAIAPAVFALAEKRHADGRLLADALLAGYQALARISYASGWSAYQRGFHATGTVGTLAAAVGCAKLLGLDEEGYVAALGLAATQAAGLKVSFGTMAKHLNAGKAAANGLLAAELAAIGFTAAADALEGHQGFLRTHGDIGDFDLDRADRALGHGHAVTQLMFKPHAACGGTHSTIDSITRAVGDRPIDLADIERVDVTVATDLLDMCGIAEPRTGLEGKFSLRHAAALALGGRSTGPSGFTDQAVLDPDNRAARALVHLSTSPRLAVDGPAEVDVRLRNGEHRAASVNPYVPIPEAELRARYGLFAGKFSELVTPVLGQRQTEALLEAISAFEEFDDMTAFTRLTATGEARLTVPHR
jgi:2-methylcitrate dehydratase PrpD